MVGVAHFKDRKLFSWHKKCNAHSPAQAEAFFCCSCEVVGFINREQKPFWDCRNCTESFCDIAVALGSWSDVWIPRSKNYEAHDLYQVGMNSSSEDLVLFSSIMLHFLVY